MLYEKIQSSDAVRWPKFPEISHIRAHDAEFIAQASSGIHGLVHLLKQTRSLSNIDSAQSDLVNPLAIDDLLAGLSALSEKLVECVEEWHSKAVNDFVRNKNGTQC